MNEPVPLIVFHADCADGFTAAWVAHRFFTKVMGVTPELRRGVYGQGAVTPEDCEGRDVYLVDFSYRRPHVEAMAKKAKSICILDHHESAWKEWGTMGEPGSGREGLRYEDGNIYAYFRRDQSGAMVTWMHFNPNAPGKHLDMWALRLVEYVQDRDLWQFKLPDSRALNAFIFSYEYTLENWERLANVFNNQAEIADAVAEGLAIERKHFKDIKEFLALGARTMVLAGQTVPVANVPYHWCSDAARILLDDFAQAPFAATYYDRGDGRRVFSLRSNEGGANVADIARSYGGGGHPHSSGFEQPIGWEGDRA